MKDINSIRDFIAFDSWGYPDFDSILVDDFSDTSRIHNWRNYVSEDFKEHWLQLPEDVRLLIWYMANKDAGREEWD